MVEVNGYGQQGAAAQDPFDFINSGGVKGLAWVTKDDYGRSIDLPVGTGFTVQTVQMPEVMQQRDFDTQEPKFYRDGNPMMMLKVICATDPNEVLREGPEDNGERAVYFRNQSLRALQDEMRRNGVKVFGIGTVMRITLVDLKNTGKGNPQKIFDVKMNATPLSNPQADAILAPPAQQVQPQAQQGWAPQAPVQQFPQVQQPPVQQFPPQQVMAPPVQQFAAPVQQQAQPAAPVFQQPQFPQAPPVGAAAVLAAGYTEVPAQPVQQTPVAPPAQQGGVPVVTQQMLDAVNLLIENAGFTREAAISSVAHNDAALVAAIDAVHPF